MFENQDLQNVWSQIKQSENHCVRYSISANTNIRLIVNISMVVSWRQYLHDTTMEIVYPWCEN